MKNLPKRIEAFDNSNLHGRNPVCGMVCFVDGRALRKEYRRFNIKTVQGIDDFKSMQEIIFRRYSRQIREKKTLPDLIVIDGGKGQLSAAKKILDKLKLSDIAVVGIAKKLEEVFIPNSKYPQNISKSSPALYLIRKIRDEVHRYAITFHRNKRDKGVYKSLVSIIPGLGIKRYQKLFMEYKNLNNMLEDSPRNMSFKTKIPTKVCEQIIKEVKKIK